MSNLHSRSQIDRPFGHVDKTVCLLDLFYHKIAKAMWRVFTQTDINMEMARLLFSGIYSKIRSTITMLRFPVTALPSLDATILLLAQTTDTFLADTKFKLIT